MSHTPGPWTVTASDEHFGEYRIAEASLEQQNSDYDFDDGAERAARNDKGNARLIAAAPDLLAICKSVENKCPLADDQMGTPLNPSKLYSVTLFGSEIKELSAAIAKAKGQP